MSPEWVSLAVVLLLVTHLLVLAWAIHLGRRREANAREDAEAAADGGVHCTDCGETNEPDFRYCRACVTELPTDVSFAGGGSGSEGRRTL